MKKKFEFDCEISIIPFVQRQKTQSKTDFLEKINDVSCQTVSSFRSLDSMIELMNVKN